MNTPLILFLAILFVTSGMVSAQVQECDHHFKSDNHNAVFHQTNGINHEILDEYDYYFKTQHNGLVPYMSSLRYNRVDGLFLGVGTDVTDSFFGLNDIYGLSADGFIGYSTAMKNWQYRASVTKHIGRSFRVGGEVLNSTSTEDIWRSSATENSITGLIAGYDFHDYYNATGYALYSEIDLGDMLTVSASYNYTTYSSLSANTEFSLFNKGEMSRINPAIDPLTDEINQESIGFEAQLNSQGFGSGIFNSQLFGRAELGDQFGFNNDFAYNKYELVSHTYFKLDKGTLLKFRLLGGSITGEVPEFKQFMLGGIGSLRAAGYKAFRGNRMLMSNAELIFGNIWNFDRNELSIDGVYLSLFMDSGWTTFADTELTHPLDGFEKFGLDKLNHSIGFGIGVDLIRLEVATPVAGSEGQTSFWVRLNPTF